VVPIIPTDTDCSNNRPRLRVWPMYRCSSSPKADSLAHQHDGNADSSDRIVRAYLYEQNTALR